jgi:hypothetical protein
VCTFVGTRHIETGETAWRVGRRWWPTGVGCRGVLC